MRIYARCSPELHDFKRYFKVKQTKDGDMEIPTGKGKRELVRYVDAHEMTIRNKVNIILDHWIQKGPRRYRAFQRNGCHTVSKTLCLVCERD